MVTNRPKLNALTIPWKNTSRTPESNIILQFLCFFAAMLSDRLKNLAPVFLTNQLLANGADPFPRVLLQLLAIETVNWFISLSLSNVIGQSDSFDRF